MDKKSESVPKTLKQNVSLQQKTKLKNKRKLLQLIA